MAKGPMKSFRFEDDVLEILSAQPDMTAYIEEAVRAHVLGRLELDDAALDILDLVGDSATYLSSVVEQHERTWRSALSFLRGVGWTVPALRAACDVLNGYWTEEGRPATWAALELHDGAELATSKHEVDPETWAQRCAAVRDNEVEARALLALVREFWCHNAQVDAALGLGDGS